MWKEKGQTGEGDYREAGRMFVRSDMSAAAGLANKGAWRRELSQEPEPGWHGNRVRTGTCWDGNSIATGERFI